MSRRAFFGPWRPGRSNGVTSPTSSDYRTLPLRACLAVYAIMGWCIQKVTGGAQPGFSALADTPPIRSRIDPGSALGGAKSLVSALSGEPL